MDKKCLYYKGEYWSTMYVENGGQTSADPVPVPVDLINAEIEYVEEHIRTWRNKIVRYAITNPRDYMIAPKDAKYSDDQMMYFDGVLNSIENDIDSYLELLREDYVKVSNLEFVKYNIDDFTWLDDM